MAISRIKTDGIQDDAVTSPKIGHNPDFDGQYVRVPHGTTAERPGSPAAGFLRFNTTIGTLEQWNTTTNSWQAIDSPPIISTLAYAGSATAADPAGGETITLTGSNFKAGATVTVGGTTAPSVSVVSSTSITFTTPAKTAGDYDVVVTNTNGLAATLQNGISFNGTPAFTTAAGNVGSVQEDVAMSTITIVAAEPDGGTLAFSVTSGALPTGVSLGSANGQLTGTPNVNVTSDTTYNFTVTATDDENQTNSRAFNLIVLRPVYATQIANSLKLVHSDTSSLTKTWGGNATDGTRGTMSAWVKRGGLTNVTGNHQYWFHSCTGTDNSGHMDIKFNTDDTISIGRYSDTPLSGTAKYRDTTAWMHIVVVWDTTDASAANNKVTVYVNGTAIPGSYANISQNDVFPWTKNGNALYIGKHATVNRPFDGYLADIHLIDGQALAPTAFAEEYYGVWTPKAYFGTYGNNGFKLNFANSADIGNDVSSNNNDLTPANINARDVFPDSPTINFATYNQLINRRDVVNVFPEFTRGNLKASYPNAGGNVTYSFGTHSASSGKWYYEVYMTATGSNTTVGIGGQVDIDSNGGQNVLYRNTGAVSTTSGGSKDQDGASYANGDIIGCAYDLDNGIVKYFKNGTLQSTVTGITTTNTYLPFTRGTTSENNFANFGQDSTFDGLTTAGGNADGNGIGNFKYAVPSGHLALCNKNLSESTINTSVDERPEDHFDTILYQAATSDGTYTHGNISFQADLAWIKERVAGERHFLIDSVRGNQSVNDKFLVSSDTAAEGTNGVGGTTFTQTSTGYQFVETSISSGELYYNNRTYVGWNWKAGGTPTASNSNTSGAMTANSVSLNGTLQSSYTPSGSPTQYPTKMSINTKAGFSIVGWTGAGAIRTLPHGLNSAPEMMILRGRDARVWSVYHKNIANAGYYMQLNSSNAQSADGAMFNSTAPDANLFTIGTYNYVNSVNYIGYFWHSVPGYSKFGTYVGTSNATGGAYVECGFKPAFVMVKCSTNTGSWFVLDSKRDPSNETLRELKWDLVNAEVANAAFMDFTATGFKLRTTGGAVNAAGQSYIFMAFAEDPYKYAEIK